MWVIPKAMTQMKELLLSPQKRKVSINRNLYYYYTAATFSLALY